MFATCPPWKGLMTEGSVLDSGTVKYVLLPLMTVDVGDTMQ